MELVLDRKAAECASGPRSTSPHPARAKRTAHRREDARGIHFFRRALVQQKIEEATDTMIARLSKTKTNAEFLKLIAR